jgi:DNA replication regulator DPB11
VYKSEQALVNHPNSCLDSCDLESASLFLLSPFNTAESTLPPIPNALSKAERVTEWWFESMMFKNKFVDPNDHRLCRPFFEKQLEDFDKLIITSTSFVNEERQHVSRMINLLGATYEEYLRPGVSVLICATNTPSLDKLRFARENSIPVVGISWLWSCIDVGKTVSFDNYLLGKSTNSQDSSTHQTTDTMTLPSAMIGKSHKER